MSSAVRDHESVRRRESFPRRISRAISDGMGFMVGRRRNQHQPSSNVPLQHPSQPRDFPVVPLPHPSQPQDIPVVPALYPSESQDVPVVHEELTFSDSFEQQYGITHPFFYACHFREALKLAEQDQKFIFLYLHSPEHPSTHTFCRETLCSELVTQFLDVNFICWGAPVDRVGLQMVATLRPTSFPCCAVIAPAPGGSIAVLRQIEGPISPGELVEILQRTLEEQGLAFGSSKAKQEEKIRSDRRLREEQDAAYLAALQIDREIETHKNLASRERVQKPVEAPHATRHYEKQSNNSVGKQHNKVQGSTSSTTSARENQYNGIAIRGSDSQPTQILVRFPNGERTEQTFLCTDRVQSIFSYIDSLGLPGIGNYRLISNFPKRVYGVDQMRMTLKDAGLYPKASLFLEPMRARGPETS